MIPNRRNELLAYLQSLYIPKKKSEELRHLADLILKTDIRAIDKQDENTIHCNCLVILTRGKGTRESYSGYEITRIDIGKVSSTMASVAIFNNDSNRFDAKRIRRLNIKINILEERSN